MTHAILILGGGTAGWLTAAYLAATRPPGPDSRITVIESPDLGIIGVGEGTFPSLRATLATIGIDESELIREAEATFKQGVQFEHWLRSPGAAGNAAYLHPFSLPSRLAGQPELLPYWLLGEAGADTGFADAVTLQASMVAAHRAPRRATHPHAAARPGGLNYAYHLDAVRFAFLLRRRAEALGVRRIEAEMRTVHLGPDGAIAALETDRPDAGGETRHQADLYVDCSGFRAELIGRALGVPFLSVGSQLFADRAVALQVPYPRPDAAIPSVTRAIAQQAGWCWDIGLRHRRGIGYVYSAAHTDATAAEAALRAYAGPGAQDLPVRHLRFQSGYRTQPWLRNCVAIGLSGGFLEPLEASGIGLIETAVTLLAHLLPGGGDTEPVARHFNHLMTERYRRVVDFLKLHYALTQRRDSQFWRDNADPASWSDRLTDLLAIWRHRPPHRLDFIADLEMYGTASWQYVLYGMEYRTRLANDAAYSRRGEARQAFAALRAMAPVMRADLPDHRALVTQIATAQAA